MGGGGEAIPNSLFIEPYKTTCCAWQGGEMPWDLSHTGCPPLLFAGDRGRDTPFPTMVGVLDKGTAVAAMTPSAFY